MAPRSSDYSLWHIHRLSPKGLPILIQKRLQSNRNLPYTLSALIQAPPVAGHRPTFRTRFRYGIHRFQFELSSRVKRCEDLYQPIKSRTPCVYPAGGIRRRVRYQI